MAALKAELQDLRKRELRYMKEKTESENEFGKKRAMFKDLFMSKEGERLFVV